MILADKIIALRKKSGWSQEELAQQLNVTRQSVSKWEGAQSVPDIDKILQMSRLFGVSTDYLLKDELEEPELAATAEEDAQALRRVTLAEASEYLRLRKEAAPKRAIATFLCVISPITLIMLAALSKVSSFGISENAAAGIGLCVLIVLVAVAVMLFMSCAAKERAYDFLESEPFETEYGGSGMVKERRKEIEDSRTRLNMIGTVLCILSVIPLFAALFINPTDIICVAAMCALLLLVGIACIMFVLGVTALMDRFARHHFKRVSLGLVLLLQMPLVACSGMLYLAKFPTFYSLPIAMALAFTVWGLYFWLHGRSTEKAAGWYLAGSLCMALVVACRPQFLIFSLLAFPLFWRKFITERHLFTKRGSKEFVCLLAPYFVVAAGIMMYNRARFGSFFDFGANYNLTVNDMTQRGMNAGRLLPALFAYFLQTPTTTGVFPWLQPATFDTTYLGQTIKEVTFGGILVCLPILWVLAFAKPILSYRIRERSTHTVASVVMTMLVSALIVACLDAQMAGILQRYTADYSILMLIPSILLCFIANDALAPDREHDDSGTELKVGSPAVPKVLAHRLFLRVLGVLVFLSLLYSTLVCFIPETGWYSDVYAWAYQDLIEMVEFWT